MKCKYTKRWREVDGKLRAQDNILQRRRGSPVLAVVVGDLAMATTAVVGWQQCGRGTGM
ncbi:hypothetical protein HN51_005350, partial [Arachis hypogaea]